MTTKAIAPSITRTPTISQVATWVLQRKCDCGASTKGGTKCSECEETKDKNAVLQRSAINSESAAAVPSIVHEVLRSSGQPLDGATSEYMGTMFGRDFSHVRIHTDTVAARSAMEVAASAFTVGRHIAFASGAYNPSSPNGKRLLAHELTHVVQQEGLPEVTSGLVIADATSSQEQEADSAADSIVAGTRPSPIRRHSASVLQRQERKRAPGAAGGCGLCFERTSDDDPIYARIGAAVHKQVQEAFAIERPRLPTLHEKRFKRDRTSNDSDMGDFGKAGAPDLLKISFIGTEAQLWANTDGIDPPDRPSFVIEFGEIKPDNERGIESGRKKLGDYDTLFATKDVYAHRLDISAPRPFRFEEPSVTIRPKAPNAPKDACEQTLNVRQHSTAGLYLYSCEPSWGELVGRCECDRMNANAIATDTTELLDYPIKGAKDQDPLIFKLPPTDTMEVLVEGKGGTKSETTVWTSLVDDVNVRLSNMVPGMLFLRVQRRKSGGFDKVLVAINTKSSNQPNAIPIEIQNGSNIYELDLNQKTKTLSSKVSNKRIPFTFPGMSPGELTQVAYSEEKGLSGKGVIRPDISLLRGVELQIAFSGEELRVTAPVPKEKLKSLPGLRITEAGLNFELSPEFKPSGDIKFEIGPKQKPLGSGAISVSADEQGFLAQGDLNARVPGFDESTTKVTYRKETGWEGETKLRTSKDFVKNADVTVRLNDKGLDVVGNLSIALPGDQTIDLSVAKSANGNSITFKGSGEFKVPGDKLKPVKLDFVWDGEKLTATGETGFEFKGFTGRMNVRYHDGKVSGNGGLDFVKGKSKGKLNIKMSPNQKFSGDGEVTYKLTDNLIATAGIAVDENEKVTLKGALEFPKPIELFKPFGGEKEIFSAGVSIPIPGASIGPVGLKARIEGGLSAGYRIGPGELRNVKLQTMLNPFEENPDVDLKLSAQLYIGANAHISGSISGAIMVDAAIASASGGLRVTVTAELDGHLAASSMIEYQKGHFSVEGNLDVLLKLLLKLALDSFVKAEAGVGPFKVKTEKDWRLAAYTYDPGMQIGIRSKAPIRYDSSQPFQAPSLDQIEIVKPNLNLPDMMQKIFANSASSEVEKQ